MDFECGKQQCKENGQFHWRLKDSPASVRFLYGASDNTLTQTCKKQSNLDCLTLPKSQNQNTWIRRSNVIFLDSLHLWVRCPLCCFILEQALPSDGVKMTISSTKLTSRLHPEEFTSFLVILAVVLRLNLSHAPAVGMEISLKENRFCYQKQERLNWGRKNQQKHLSAVPLG